MTSIVLQGLTGNRTVDNVLTAVVGIFELAFPGLIRAYYLTGSYQDGSAAAASDIDLFIIAKDSLSADRRASLRQMDDRCEMLSPVKLDVGFYDEVELQRHCPVSLKLSSTFILDYENHFMAQYHAFLLSELRSDNPEVQEAALARLNRIQVRG